MDAKVIERFNRLQRCFGRLQLVHIGENDITFKQGFRSYTLWANATVEWTERDCMIASVHSRWINGIASGGVRNDAGEIAITEHSCNEN